VVVLPRPGWQRVVVTALLITPLILVVILMFPALLAWPVLSDKKRSDFLNLIQKLVDWARVAGGGAQQETLDSPSDPATLPGDP
jgi:hypothetical protein